MNEVILIGRLTRDPEVRKTQGTNGEMTIARYTLAVDRRRRSNDNQQEADFISCVAFGRTGEFAEKYLHKGTKIGVTGRLQTGSYTKQDGTKVYTTDVNVQQHEFVESRRDGDGQGGFQQGGYQAPAQGGYQQPQQPQQNYQQPAYQQPVQGGYQQQPTYQQPQQPQQNAYQAPAQGGYQQPQQNAQPDMFDGFMSIPEGIDEELPFA